MSDADVKGALKGLYSRIIYSGDGKYLFLRNFVKHQKNFPLNEKNPAHRGIIKLLVEKLQTFNLQTINDYFQSPMNGASMGLQSPIGKGKGKGNGNGKDFSLVLSFSEKTENSEPPNVENHSTEGEECEVLDELSFESVWAMYGKKGNRKTSSQKWGKLKNHCKLAALKHISEYVKATPDIQYRKNFETYINQETWNDEIINRNGSNSPQSLEEKQSDNTQKLLEKLKNGKK
jgi:hypothetical protein